jgi:hypothetical protein
MIDIRQLADVNKELEKKLFFSQKLVETNDKAEGLTNQLKNAR